MSVYALRESNSMADGLRARDGGTVSAVRSCRVCNATEGLSMCASCKSVFYCGKQHQVADWKDHKATCKEIKRSRELISAAPENMAANQNVFNTAALCQQQSEQTATCQQSRLGNVLVTEHKLESSHSHSYEDPGACMFYVDTNPDPDQDKTASSFWQCGDTEAFSTGDLSSSLLAACADEHIQKRDSSSSLSSAYSSSGSVHSLGGGLHHTDSQSSASSNSIGIGRSFSSFSSTSSLGSSCPSSGSDMTGFDNQGPRRKILKQKRLHKDLSSIHGNRRPSHGSMDQNRPVAAADQSNKTLSDYVVKCLNDYGICVVDNFLGEEKGNKILQDVIEIQHAGSFKEGQLVNRNDTSRKIRGDQIAWVEIGDSRGDNIGVLVRKLDSLLMTCNGRLSKYDINGRTKVRLFYSCNAYLCLLKSVVCIKCIGVLVMHYLEGRDQIWRNLIPMTIP